MLDIKRIVDNRQDVEKALLKRMKKDEFDLDELIELYDAYLKTLHEYEEKRADQNRRNDRMAEIEKGSKEFDLTVSDMKKVAAEVKELETKVQSLRDAYEKKLFLLPNIPDDDVPSGGKESNEVLEEWGDEPQFSFETMDHLTLGKRLGILDFDRASRMSGAHMPMYVGDGTRLLWALVTYFMEKHHEDGYVGIIPPHLINRDSAFIAGQLPKFENDVYWTQDDQCLLPTAETALVNFHNGETLDSAELPEKYYAYTPCYRREAGGYGTRDRGLMRLHQFHKVEMFQFVRDEDSEKTMEELVERASSLVRSLGLRYRIVKLAGGDLAFGMAKTIDIEIWLPYDKGWTEVSSISNSRDFQSRRGNARYREKDGTMKYVHTLNASGLATPRLIVALLETYQQKDGSIRVPEILQESMGKKVIK